MMTTNPVPTKLTRFTDEFGARLTCNCEHVSHFAPVNSHAYGKSEATHTISTDYGPFDLCPACVTAVHCVIPEGA